jgi:predicted ATPase
VIRSLLDAREPEQSSFALESEIAPDFVHEVAQIVPELLPRQSASGTPAIAKLDPNEARFRLFDAVTNFLKIAARSFPILIVLDDLHDADEASLAMLRLVAHELKGAAIQIVATYRDAEVRRSPTLTKLIGELSRDARTIALGGLSEPEVASFVEMSAGQTPDPELVAKLYAATDGSPLFVEGIVRLLIAQRDVGRSSLSDLPFTIPDGVRAAIRLRVGALSKDAISLLSIAAVMGKEFEVRHCQPVAGFSSHKIYRLLDEAATAGSERSRA